MFYLYVCLLFSTVTRENTNTRIEWIEKKKKVTKPHTLFYLLGYCDLVFAIEEIVYSKVSNNSLIEK